jgi:hypothetical protein
MVLLNIFIYLKKMKKRRWRGTDVVGWKGTRGNGNKKGIDCLNELDE